MTINKIEYRGYTIDHSPYNNQYSLHSATHTSMCAYSTLEAVKQYIDKLEAADAARNTSHLVAIMERVQRERARLETSTAKTSLREMAFRAKELRNAEKELEDEYKFLGMTPTAELPDMSADDLLAELLA